MSHDRDLPQSTAATFITATALIVVTLVALAVRGKRRLVLTVGLVCLYAGWLWFTAMDGTGQL